MGIFAADDPDARCVGSSRVFTDHAHVQALAGAEQVEPARESSEESQVDEPVVLQEGGIDKSQDRADARQAEGAFRQFQRGSLGESADPFRGVGICQGFTERIGESAAEDGQGQAGDILLGAEGDRQDGIEQRTKAGAEHSGENGQGDIVRVVGSDETRRGTHHHQAFDAEVEVARAFSQ